MSAVLACTLGGAGIGCNQILSIEEPETPQEGSAGNATPASLDPALDAGVAATVGGGALADGTPVATTGFAWAAWPMPNPASAGLPNAASYDGASLPGVVVDLVTGLQWQGALDDISRSWSDAQTFCSLLDVSGGGFRLPSRIELLSIVDFTNPGPAIDVKAFPATPSDYFWTSSKYAGDPTRAWTVNFGFSDGLAEKSDLLQARRVRCVR